MPFSRVLGGIRKPEYHTRVKIFFTNLMKLFFLAMKSDFINILK